MRFSGARRAWTVPALICLIAVGWSAGAAAARERPRMPEPPPPDPVLQMEGSSYLEVDLGLVVNDLLEVYLDALRRGAPAAGEPGGAPNGQTSPEARVERIEALLDAAGLPALDRLRVQSETAIDRERTRVTVTVAPDEDAGLIGSLLAIPPAKARFGRYLAADDVAILVSLPTWAPSFAAAVEFLDRPELGALLPDTRAGAGADSLIAALNLKQELLPLLSGELDYVQFAAATDSPPQMGATDRGDHARHRQRLRPDVALVIGAHGGAALRDRILDLSLKITGLVASRMETAIRERARGQKGGAAADSSAQARTRERAAMMAMAGGLIEGLRSLPGETHGEFTFQKLPGGAALATSPDWLIVTTAPARLAALVEGSAEGMAIPKSRGYARVDGGALIEALLAHGGPSKRDGERAAASGPAAALRARMAAILETAAKQGQTGTLEATATSRPDQFSIDLRRTGRVSRTGYALLRELVATLPALQAERAKKRASEKASAALKGEAWNAMK